MGSVRRVVPRPPSIAAADYQAREHRLPRAIQPVELWQACRAEPYLCRLQNWAFRCTGRNVDVGINVFVTGNGLFYPVLKAVVGRDEKVVDKLSEKADELLERFFPGI